VELLRDNLIFNCQGAIPQNVAGIFSRCDETAAATYRGHLKFHSGAREPSRLPACLLILMRSQTGSPALGPPTMNILHDVITFVMVLMLNSSRIL